jgi:diaminohydroxyphosphoribosylaminopyrimidine deaminase/5-amino-6-(5-phosphoribosylamino)uracil reductase
MNARIDAYMRRAIELSRRGFPAPNPHVGCVIVQGDEIVGEGWHDFAGGPHAEAVALAFARDLAAGSELFCTLEPCAHQGKTPPCAGAIVQAGVASVTVALLDPNPNAAGGLQVLRDAGIACEAGLLAKEAREANELFMAAMERRRPTVVVKAATTSDGFIARKDGTSKWITGEQAREMGHRLRAELGCVLVGRATVEQDDPSLTARVGGVVNQPLRVVLDPLAKLTPEYKVFNDGGETVRFVANGNASRPGDVEATFDLGFDLREILSVLYSRGVIGVLVEGGGETIASFLRERLVDRIERFSSPAEFGEGVFWLGADPPEFEAEKTGEQWLGPDKHESYRVLGT